MDFTVFVPHHLHLINILHPYLGKCFYTFLLQFLLLHPILYRSTHANYFTTMFSIGCSFTLSSG